MEEKDDSGWRRARHRFCAMMNEENMHFLCFKSMIPLSNAKCVGCLESSEQEETRGIRDAIDERLTWPTSGTMPPVYRRVYCSLT